MKKTIQNFLLAVSFGTMASFAHAQEATTLSGYTVGYDAKTKCGCLYVDKEMIEAGVATDISAKANKVCTSAKYGLGAPIDFKKVPANADYVTPAENTLISISGYWGMKEGKNTFFVTSFEPFF